MKKDNSKYNKYIITKLKQNIKEAPWTPKVIKPTTKGQGGRLLWLDSEVIPEAFYMETSWDLPHKLVTLPALVRNLISTIGMKSFASSEQTWITLVT
jgi:hypothetical protein